MTERERQIALETRSIQDGVERYRKMDRELCEKGMAGTTDWANVVLSRAVHPMVEALQDFQDRAKQGAGRRHAIVAMLGDEDGEDDKLTPEVVAYITARTIIDESFAPLRDSLAGVSLRIADRIQTEYQAMELQAAERRLYNTMNDRLDRSPMGRDPDVRTSTARHMAKKFSVPISTWSKTVKAQIGRGLVEMFVNATGLVLIEKGTKGKKTTESLKVSETLMNWVMTMRGNCELLHPVYLPMLVPPKAWTSIDDGGYLHLNPLFKGLVKSRTKGHREELLRSDLSEIFSAVNSLQNTGWRVNAWVYEQVKHAESMGLAVGDTLVGMDLPRPPKPVTGPKSAEMLAWKRQSAEIFRHNKRLGGRRKQQGMILQVADKFQSEPAIYFPYQLDFRGRVYALPSFLNPQGNDLAKGLLTFADGKPLGKTGAWWLYIHCSNCYGVDKVSFADRVKWTDENSDRILATANEPFSDLWWTEADSPWQFLAACREVAHYLAEGEGYVCSLPVAVDGSNNGLQHFSAMLRDPECGSLVNLIPTETPADIYSAVAKRVNAVLEERRDRDDLARLWLLFGVDRKVCKRPVMIVPYGGKKDGVRQYIIDAIDGKKGHPFNQRVGEAANYLRDIVWDVMAEMMPGPRQAMKWLQDAASEMVKLNRPVTWTCPNGFLAQQAYRVASMKRVACFVLGSRIQMNIKLGDKPKLDGKKQVQAFSPNFVHSLDAAALTGTVAQGAAQGLTHFAVVHDSYGTHACDVETLQNCIRNVFVRMYSGNVLADLKSQLDSFLNSPLPDPPKMGDLDVSLVTQSDYFFA